MCLCRGWRSCAIGGKAVIRTVVSGTNQNFSKFSQKKKSKRTFVKYSKVTMCKLLYKLVKAFIDSVKVNV